MPKLIIHSPAGTFDAADRQRVAVALTALALDCEELPSSPMVRSTVWTYTVATYSGSTEDHIPSLVERVSRMNNGRRLEGQVAIVTGAGTGIGEAAARAFAREGARVTLIGRREEPLQANAAAIRVAGGEALVIAGDVSRADDAERIVATKVERFGRLDCLFNNTGIQGKGGPIIDMHEAAFDELIAINLRGPWLMTRAALRAMVPAGHGGAIVNTSSFLSTAATVGTSGYSASKAGLDARSGRSRWKRGRTASASTTSIPA